MNYVVDIGHSAYSQLTKLKGEEVLEGDGEEEECYNPAMKKFNTNSKDNNKGSFPGKVSFMPCLEFKLLIHQLALLILGF